MALEDIFRALEADGEEERRQVFDKAEAEVQKIIQEAKDEAEKIRQAKMDRVMLQLRGQQTRILNEARLYKKKQIIQAKEEVLNEAFRVASEKLRRFRSTPEYEAVLEKLVQEVLPLVNPGESFTIHTAPEDQETAKRIFQRIGLNSPVAAGKSYIGGLSLEVDSGRIVYSNTINGRLDKTRRLLRTEISALLFEEGQKTAEANLSGGD